MNKVAVCVISKWEEQYLQEYVDHYKSLGFDNIVFYDNNDLGDDKQYHILKSYIDEGFVIYKDWRGKTGSWVQKESYLDCLKTYKDDFEWIAFFDADEFLELKKCDNIHQFLSAPEYRNFAEVHISWLIYDDNDLVYNDGRPLKERFTRPAIVNRAKVFGKSIVNTKVCKPVFPFKSVHFPFIDNIRNKACNPNGNIIGDIKISLVQPFMGSKAVIRHYYFKTVEEGIKKVTRGEVNPRGVHENVSKYEDRLDGFCKRFFTNNKVTVEKLDVICKYLKENKKGDQ